MNQISSILGGLFGGSSGGGGTSSGKGSSTNLSLPTVTNNSSVGLAASQLTPIILAVGGVVIFGVLIWLIAKD